MRAQSNRLGYEISFSEEGGVEIEENWDKVKRVTLDTEQPASSDALAPLLSTLPLELRAKMEAFVQACYEVGGWVVIYILCKRGAACPARASPALLWCRADVPVHHASAACDAIREGPLPQVCKNFC